MTAGVAAHPAGIVVPDDLQSILDKSKGALLISALPRPPERGNDFADPCTLQTLARQTRLFVFPPFFYCLYC